MDHTACTVPQCLDKGALYLYHSMQHIIGYFILLKNQVPAHSLPMKYTHDIPSYTFGWFDHHHQGVTPNTQFRTVNSLDFKIRKFQENHVYISLVCDKSVTTQNLAFLSYWYRCTFNRYSVITQFAKLESSCVVVALVQNYSTSKSLKVSPEKSQILSCDTVVANERYIMFDMSK
jgi:hypothetical protein